MRSLASPPTAAKLFSKQLGATPEPWTEEEQERAERAFFAAIKLSNGTFKTTNAGRFADVDDRLVAYLAEHDHAPRHCLDIAVSSGRTTLEWLHRMRVAGLEPSMTATDATMTAFLTRPRLGCAVLADRDGAPLQYDVVGHALRPWRRRLDYLTGYAILGALANLAYRLSGLRESIRRQAGALSEIQLVSPLVGGESGIELLEDDLTRPNPPALKARFDLVRAANILTPGTFSRAQLATMLATIRERLAGPGALLLVCRTDQEGVNDASLFRLGADGRFSVELRLGAGSEIEDLVLSI